MKNGFLTSEFVMSLVAAICGVLLASGKLGDGSLAAQIVGGVVSVLASLGYTSSRTQLKVADLRAPELPEPVQKV